MHDLTNRVLEYLAREQHRQFKAKELARALRVPPARYREFRDLLKVLARENKIAKLKRNHYGHAQQASTLIGTLHVKTQGYAFLIVGEGQEDVFISQKHMSTALNRDLVKVQLFARPSGRKPEGRVIEVLRRARQHIVGTLRKGKHFYFVKPDEMKLLHDIYIPDEYLDGAKPGQKVAVAIETWDDPSLNPEGRIVKVLGFPDEAGVDVLSVAFSFDLPANFPAEVERAAEQLNFDITPEMLRHRLDLRDWLTFTIDPEDAKDFDDAVSLRRLANGNYELGVHIADVSHYVPEGSPIDKEALARGTSVYLVDRVVPMLPEKLSNDLCSLKPHTDRLTYSCIMEVTPKGEVVNYRIAESIIHSKRRFNYEEVQKILDGKKSSTETASDEDERKIGPELDQILREMNNLAHILTRRRLRNGSLDFDTPEVKIILDETGFPVEIRRALRQDSNRLIEEFMLLANQTVTKHVDLTLAQKRKKPPFIYRIHEPPDPLKMEEFALFVKAFGFNFDHQQMITSKVLSKFLREIEGEPEADIIENVMLRSLMKAKYSTENVGHFGLAFKHYTHFTSPIRRYPDLAVHRVLKAYAHGYRPEIHDTLASKLSYAAQQSSEREIVALEAERASIKMKQAQFMLRHLGDEFEGIISGVVSFGIFVEIPKFLVEGLVHISDLEDDFYVFEERAHRLKGQNSGKIYRLGDEVRVRVVRVDPNERILDFVLIEPPRHKSLRRKKEVKKNRRKK
ncbi:MAG: ribonuclease R [candidate division KSB1 bacterium]|nr:ribonuclease R [candidate division KSB1 bacterium]MDZ7303992.1 ribonuclease R [candidate division KSB1 bacterium]MDZ7313298.1 ribonuclease R [candidate division KSB1 bacterium]